MSQAPARLQPPMSAGPLTHDTRAQRPGAAVKARLSPGVSLPRRHHRGPWGRGCQLGGAETLPPKRREKKDGKVLAGYEMLASGWTPGGEDTGKSYMFAGKSTGSLSSPSAFTAPFPSDTPGGRGCHRRCRTSLSLAEQLPEVAWLPARPSLSDVETKQPVLRVTARSPASRQPVTLTPWCARQASLQRELNGKQAGTPRVVSAVRMGAVGPRAGAWGGTGEQSGRPIVGP